MAARTEPARPHERVTAQMLVRRACTLVVAGVAAHAPFQHQRDFAMRGGANPTGATLFPLSVDGLLVLATVGVLKLGQQASRRGRSAVWLSFWLGIAVSLAANIAAAPTLTWQPVLVAACRRWLTARRRTTGPISIILCRCRRPGRLPVIMVARPMPPGFLSEGCGRMWPQGT